jgi:uncharacterized protein YbgA (DUF1722 family)/uncharacterized protein YbbK (DUF523 family)
MTAAESSAAHPHWMHPDQPIRVGISSCLLGEAVRFDGQHKHDAYVTGTLGRVFTLVPVCPEVAIGLGVPREPIRLVGDPAAPPAVGVRNAARDVSDALRAYGRRMAGELGDLSGYILKRGSPSCGMERVKVYRGKGGMPARQGVGLYAAELMAARPHLPVEEEGRLGDPGLRENFIERVYACHRWLALLAGGASPARLVEFHNRHKLALMAHGPELTRRLGRLVAEAGRRGRAGLIHEYEAEFMALLKRRATRKLHANVLHHLMGYLKRVLDGEDKAELLEVIAAYHRREVPLVVPLTLLRHHFRRHPHPCVLGQTYLAPHPAELMLRNTI